MSTSPVIDLSKIPPPKVVEELSADQIFDAMLADLRGRDPVFDALVESDPAWAILKIAAYRESLIRQRINESIRATMIATAEGSDLDNLVALLGITRVDGQSDESLRRSYIDALYGLSVAGPAQAYRFHAKRGTRAWLGGELAWRQTVCDARIYSSRPGQVDVTILASIPSCEANALAVAADVTPGEPVNGACYGVVVDRVGGYRSGASVVSIKPLTSPISAGTRISFPNGSYFIQAYAALPGHHTLQGTLHGDIEDLMEAGLLTAVDKILSADTVRPLCDTVVVRSAEVIPVVILADLTLFSGPSEEEVLKQAIAGVRALNAQAIIGQALTLSAIHRALHVAGVHKVHLRAPGAVDTVPVAANQAFFIAAWEVLVTGRVA